jgi:hypothetical protein
MGLIFVANDIKVSVSFELVVGLTMDSNLMPFLDILRTTGHDNNLYTRQ